jgi:hemerythrin-like domain-containing protein
VNVRGKGLVIVTGCGHAGAVNIVRHAQRLTGVPRLHALLGGLHLGGAFFTPSIGPTVHALTELAPDLLVPGHCTGWRAQHALAAALPDSWAQIAGIQRRMPATAESPAWAWRRGLLAGLAGNRRQMPKRAGRSSMSSDAIVILKADHKEIRNLFREFRAAGDKAVKKKSKIAGRIIELLTVHTYIENEVMYPEVCALLPDLKDDVLESYEEHHVADVLCMELAGMPAGAERFDAKASVLIENVTHHIEEEEQDWFPKVRAGLGRKQLQELGAKLERAREKAPRSPAQPSALKKTVDAIIP